MTLLFVASATVGAQEPPDTALFISTAPIRAEVMLDGTPIGTTPLLVRAIEPGEHQLTFIKPGHLRRNETVEIGPSEVVQFSATLEPNVFVGAFAATETVVAGTTYSRQDARLVLPAGTYEFSQSGVSLSLDPVYPNESALRALRVATPVVIIAAVIATIEDLLVQDSARSYFTSFLPSPATFAALTAAAASSGFLIALNRDKDRYEAETVIRELETTLTDAEAERYYLDGDRALEAGNLGTALTNYTRVVVDGGDSEYVPLALYKTARLYSISGGANLALQLFQLLVRDYPIPETYDRALKSISDICLGNGLYDDALTSLESMVFVDDLYDPADIRADIEAIRNTQAGEGSSGEDSE
ncbi:MAG: PEGA domain-containing protein [Spirochaetales bacterium]|nr:PEGA domain-containing protein [Spirochaetales bacterium]